MTEDVTFFIDSDINMFCLALILSKEEENAAIETCMRTYFAKLLADEGL